MTEPLASNHDFERWPGVVVTEAQADQVEFLLERASSLVREHTGQTWITVVDDVSVLGDVPDIVRDIVVEMAIRVWNNPKNIKSDTTGPFTAQLAPGDMVLTDDQKNQLVPWMTKAGKPAVWTLGTTRGVHDLNYLSRNGCDAVFLETIPPGDPIPWDVA